MDGSVARRFLLGLAPWVGAVALWYGVRWSGFVNESLIPAPHQVAAKFVELLLHEGLLFDIYASTRRVFLGVARGIHVAVPVGFLLGWYRPARTFADPMINFFRALPPIALIPLVIVYFGVDEIAKLVILFYASFFSGVIVMYEGVSQITPLYVRVAQTLGAGEFDIFLARCHLRRHHLHRLYRSDHGLHPAANQRASAGVARAGRGMSVATSTKRAQFDHVSLIFDTPKGKLTVVDDVTYDINDGEFIAVIGPSGCGKTTMMSMLAGFQKPTTGKVLFDGTPVNGPGPERGVICQEYGVVPWLTVIENIAFGLQLKANHVPASERKRICEHYLSLMGLTDFANSYPKHLSGGMRQRLAIARAYAVKPQFLLMDEPFGALDAQTRANMQNLLLNVLATEGKTVMLITHSVEEAIYLASRIVVVTARPARIKEIIDVPFGHPRDESLQERVEFVGLRSHIRELVMSEYRAQQALALPASFSE